MVTWSFINIGETSTSLNEINKNNKKNNVKTAQAPLYISRMIEKTDAYVVSGQKILSTFVCIVHFLQFRNIDEQTKYDNIIVCFFPCKKLSL